MFPVCVVGTLQGHCPVIGTVGGVPVHGCADIIAMAQLEYGLFY